MQSLQGVSSPELAITVNSIIRGLEAPSGEDLAKWGANHHKDIGKALAMDAVQLLGYCGSFFSEVKEDVITRQKQIIDQKVQELTDVFIVMHQALTKPTYSGNAITATIYLANNNYNLTLRGTTEDQKDTVKIFFNGDSETYKNSYEDLQKKLKTFVNTTRRNGISSQ